MIASLSLLDWRIQADLNKRKSIFRINILIIINLKGNAKSYHKVHLSVVFVRQQEQSQYRRHWDLVVEGFTVKLEERLEYLDVVATAAIVNNLIIIKNSSFSVKKNLNYRGVRQWISRNMAIASPLTFITEALSMTC